MRASDAVTPFTRDARVSLAAGKTTQLGSSRTSFYHAFAEQLLDTSQIRMLIMALLYSSYTILSVIAA